MRQLFGHILLVISLVTPGCARWQSTPPIANPVFVPIADRDYVWDHLVDMVDDYYKIKREDRVRLVVGLLTEGRIETVPDTSSTLLEPWRMDTVSFYDKLLATFQTMRTYAVVRVMPAEGGFFVELMAFKELEDNVRPLFSVAGSATLRYDTSQAHTRALVEEQVPAKGWIPQGRDRLLEQRMLDQLLAKLGLGPAYWQTVPPFCNLPRSQNSSRMAVRPAGVRQ